MRRRSCRRIRGIMRRNWRVHHVQPLWSFVQHRLDHTRTTSASSSSYNPPKLRRRFGFMRVPNRVQVSEQSSNKCSTYHRACTGLAVESPSRLHQQYPHSICRASASNSANRQLDNLWGYLDKHSSLNHLPCNSSCWRTDGRPRKRA